jgi:hypothetical protein
MNSSSLAMTSVRVVVSDSQRISLRKDERLKVMMNADPKAQEATVDHLGILHRGEEREHFRSDDRVFTRGR